MDGPTVKATYRVYIPNQNKHLGAQLRFYFFTISFIHWFFNCVISSHCVAWSFCRSYNVTSQFTPIGDPLPGRAGKALFQIGHATDNVSFFLSFFMYGALYLTIEKVTSAVVISGQLLGANNNNSNNNTCQSKITQSLTYLILKKWTTMRERFCPVSSSVRRTTWPSPGQ